MSANALASPRFVRRTQLAPHEYRKNFRQIDSDIITALTSREADAVTPLMSKIYLRLISAPAHFWEREGVLRFAAELRDDRHVTAWVVLCDALGVASATVNKALRWMHEQGIIGYFAGKNGVGVRIFINRASSSIGSRTTGKKILDFPRTSSDELPTPADEAAFNDSFADLEVLDTNVNSRAPKNGAEQAVAVKKFPIPQLKHSANRQQAADRENAPRAQTALPITVSIEEIVSRLRYELEPSLRSAARQASAQEHERTREWLESRGLPKAARVAQREIYNVLRKNGLIRDAARSASIEVGRGSPAQEPQQLSDSEVEDLAQACIAMFTVKGQSPELTLSEMSVEAGGFLLPEDVPRIRARTAALLKQRVT